MSIQRDTLQREQRGILAVNLGLAANILLSVLKTTFGIFGHSPALLADGINSTSDVAYYVIVRIFMGLAKKPADDEHPYGHNQLESISAVVVGAFVITTAIAIFWSSMDKAYELYVSTSDFSGATLGALAVGLFTVLLKIGLNSVTTQIGKQTNNPAVIALAFDHRNDIFAASAASVGIFLGRMGYSWVDPLAGALVALLILRTGIEIIRETSVDLMDTIPGRNLRLQIESILAGQNHVLKIEEILAHRFGPYLVVNITICIDGLLSVTEGDQIATRTEELLMEGIEMLRRVHVHYHPMR